MNSKIRAVLDRLETRIQYEHSRDDIPIEERMLAITPDTGSFYNLLLKLIEAKSVLEIGTSFGYSTLWFADALGCEEIESNPRIITIERSHRKVLQATSNFRDAGVIDFIQIREGAARVMLEDISSLASHQEYFDFIFIDADKENAIEYFKRVIHLVRVGGLIAADNLYQPQDCVEPMARYSEYIRTRTDVQTTSVSVGNGQELTIRLSK